MHLTWVLKRTLETWGILSASPDYLYDVISSESRIRSNRGQRKIWHTLNVNARWSMKKLKYRVRSYENLRRRRQIKTGYVHIMELTNLFQLGFSKWFNSTYNWTTTEVWGTCFSGFSCNFTIGPREIADTDTSDSGSAVCLGFGIYIKYRIELQC